MTDNTEESRTTQTNQDYTLDILVYNGTSTVQTGELELQSESTEVYGKDFELVSEEQGQFDTGINEPNPYELRITTNNKTEISPIYLSQDEIRLNSQYLVLISPERITGAMQE